MGGSEETGGGGRYVKYSNEQLRILEKEYNDCPKPSAAKRASLVKDYPELAGIDVKSIKVWFQNRRCREKQRKESSRLVGVNSKLTALNKLLLEENDRLTKQALQLSSENRFLKLRLDSVNQALPKLENGAPAPNLSLVLANPNEDALPEQIRKLTDAALEQSASLSLPTEDSAGTTVNAEGDAAAKGSLLSLGLAHATPTYGHAPHAPRGLPNTPGLPQSAQDACQEFLAKATGNAVEWIQLPLLKSGAESLGITSIAQGARGVAARVCGLVALPAPKAAELLKDKAAWLRGCRRCEVLGGFTAAGGRMDLLYTQMYAPTTLAPPRDFCTLRYTTILDDGAIVICERSLSAAEASVPAAPAFVRGEVFAGGFLLRPCDGGGCILIAVDHLDLEPWSVLDVLKPLYSSSAVLAHQSTLSSLRFLKRVAMEEGPDSDTGTTHQPAAWRVITERLARGFNEAVNAFADEQWVSLPSDGMDDVSVMARANSDKDAGVGVGGGGSGGGVLCARASMLLQIVPPSTLVRFMHDHRAEWADPDIDASTAAAIQGAMRRQRPHGDKGRLPSDVPLAVAMDDQEFLELVKLDGRNSYSKDGNTFLLQLCTCPDVTSAAAAQLVFAPVDAAAAGADVPLLPSGFRVIPVDTDELKADGLRGGRLGQNSLDAHAVDPAGSGDESAQCWKSVLSIAFQFAYEAHSEEAVAAVARQYVRSVVASVQRVAMALAPTCIKMLAPPPRSPPASPDAVLLAKRVVASYALHTGAELTDANKDLSPEGVFKAFWLHPSAILCWVVKASPEYTFANKAGLDILGTSIAELASVEWNKSMDEDGRKMLYAASSQVLQQGYAHLPPGVTLSCQGHSAGYEKACMWKVVDERGNMMCVAIMYDNWTALHYH